MAQQHFSGGRVNLVGARIRQLRKSRKLTQTALSERIGVQQSDLSRMEKGEYKVGLDTLFKVLSVFELDMATFFDGSIEAPDEDDSEAWRDYLRLDSDSRREVQEFIRFKMQKKDPSPPNDPD
jgi:transcriptional regulator with XRE-family HTH domain